MTFKTKPLGTSVVHHTSLIMDLIDGRNNAEIKMLLQTGMNDGARALVDYKGSIYSIEVKPTYEAVDNTVPTLKHVFLNDTDHQNENECDGCHYLEHDAGDSDINSNTCCPPSCECVCEDENECPAAIRIHKNMLDEYDAEHELGDYAPPTVMEQMGGVDDTADDLAALTIRGDKGE